MNQTNHLEDVRRRGRESDSEQTLQRTLNPLQLIVIGIGAGIFVAMPSSPR